MNTDNPGDGGSPESRLDPAVVALERALADYERENSVNQIRATPAPIEGGNRQENKVLLASTGIDRPVGAYRHSMVGAYRHSMGLPNVPAAPSATATCQHSPLTPLPANLPPALACHYRHYDPQTLADLATIKSDKLAKLAKRGIRETVLPRQRRLTGWKLHVSYGIAAEKMGGLFYTLHLGDREQLDVLKRRSALDWFLTRLRRAFLAVGITNLAMTTTLGVGRDGSIHVHGVLLPGSRELTLIDKALRKAAGKVRPGSRARQLYMKPVFYGAGAIEYSMKLWDREDHRGEREKLTATFPGQRLTHASTAMSKVALAPHEMTLPPIKPRRKRNSITVGGSALARIPAPSNTLAAPKRIGAVPRSVT